MRLAIGWLVCVVAAILITLPIWLPDFPPLVDLPQHAANLELARQLILDNGDWSGVVRSQWFTPYYGFYLPAFLLSLFMPVVLATKIVAAASILLTPASVAVVLRRRSLSPYLALLVVPGLYGFAFQWGFLSFMSACSVLVLGIDAIERYFDRRTRKGEWSIVFYSTVLFFLHAFAFAVFMIIYGIRWLLGSRHLRSAFLVIPAGVVALVWLMWTSQGSAQAMQSTLWEAGWFRLGSLMRDLLGVNFSGAEQLLGVVLVALICGGIGGSRLSKNPWRLLPLLVVLAAYFALPNRLMGTYFTYQRFSMYLLPMLLLALTPVQGSVREKGKVGFIASMAAGLLLAVVIVVQGAKALQFQRESAGFASILQAMPERQRVLYLPFDPQTLWYAAPSYLHFAQWYGAEKGGFVEFNFASFFNMPAIYAPSSGGALAPANIEWYPNQFNCMAPYVKSFGFVVVKAEIDLTENFFSAPGCDLSLLQSSGGWWLYGRKEKLAKLVGEDK